MYAVRIETVIPEDRRLVVTLPADAPVGAAEVIILSTARRTDQTGADLLRYLDSRIVPAYRRSAAELDRQINEERAAWE